ncbi:type VII secretion protein EccB [Actinokineospora fastidiosa]|uniref:Type VII secretion protein EccB n=1 Tax=Actinokineospora fastidiosa TaxID=1816 RepID=A0A918G895_9PSEU|nr:type VII secretion protein EccB [Actinokineospora fastidiosa]
MLRRMQSALVRKDAVMLHDPMRTHTRATVVGICLGAIGLIGFLIVGLLSPSPKPPDKDGIIIAQPSGAVYVLLNGTPKGQVLIPTFNLTSARLLLLSRSSPEAQGVGSQVEEGETPVSAVPAPTFVADEKLEGIARERMAGIPDAPQLLPEKDEQRISDHWAVCDEYQLDRSLNDPSSQDKIETTVLGGMPELGPELGDKAALLVEAPTKKVYLVYRTPSSANRPNTSTVRAEVDMTNDRVVDALNLDRNNVRKITVGLLNAIPEAAALRSPEIPGRGGESSAGIAGLKVGDVLEVERAGELVYYVVLRDGVQQIKKTTADLIRFTQSRQTDIPRIAPDQLPGQVLRDAVEEKDFPEVVPEVLTPTNFPVVCLGWAVVGEGPNAQGQTKVHVGQTLPVPVNATGEPGVVDITSPNADGGKIEHFYMPPGKAAVVRGSVSPADFTTGPIYLISDRGVKYGIPDARTAGALGLSKQSPAPDAIVRLLPNGASLNARDVLQTFDSVPVGDGVFTEQAKPQEQPVP